MDIRPAQSADEVLLTPSHQQYVRQGYVRVRRVVDFTPDSVRLEMAQQSRRQSWFRIMMS